ncbi:prevent-host-death protein [Burkholderia sp. MSMB1552]|nr:prevent-host-death protein [Burkholderia sp. MSMB1552]KWZ57495.1 prevent-host-death protein [Burkholderia sp. MSMB1588]
MMRTIVERFVEQSPMAIMARLVLQCALHDDWIDAAADMDDAPNGEPIRETLFALAVDAFAAIAARTRAPGSAAAGASPELGAAVTALHDGMSRLRAGWGRALVKDSVELLQPLAAMRAEDRAPAVGGMRLRVLDGGACAPGADGCACDDPARDAAERARALPVYDPALGMIVDLLPYERGRAHERALVAALLETVRAGELWIVDGRFDTDAILSGWPRGGGAFIVREYGRTLACRPLGDWHEAGVLGDGRLYEQAVGIAGDGGVSGMPGMPGMSGVFRRIEWRRGAGSPSHSHSDSPSDSGSDSDSLEPGSTIAVLTDLPAAPFDAREVVQLSCTRWRDALPLPIEPVLGAARFGNVPARAAQLARGIAALAYNALGAMMKAVAGALDLDARDIERLPPHIADGVAATYAGMMIALPPEWWRRYDRLSAATLGQIVRLLAVHVDPRSERRKRRDNRLSAKSQALLRTATLERLLHDDGDDPVANVFSLRTIAMATRDFSSNPSKALRHAGEALVMVTKYNRPIALLVSIDDWNRLLGEVRETSLTRLSFDCADATPGVCPVTLSESSLN